MNTPNLDKAKKDVAETLVKSLREGANRDDFKASGRLERSWGYKEIGERIEIYAERYAGALSDGISNKGKINSEMVDNLAAWAKRKGMRPLLRDKKGRFKKLTDKSYKSLGYLLARSIAKKGISKRFGYKGSGFVDRVVDEQKQTIKDTLLRAFQQDIANDLKNRLK